MYKRSKFQTTLITLFPILLRISSLLSLLLHGAFTDDLGIADDHLGGMSAWEDVGRGRKDRIGQDRMGKPGCFQSSRLGILCVL